MVAWFKEIIFQRVYFKWISKAGFVFIKWKFNWKEYEKNLTVNCRYLCLHRLKQCMAMGHNYHKTWIHLLNYFHQDKKIWNKMTKNAFWINLQITNGSTIMLVATSDKHCLGFLPNSSDILLMIKQIEDWAKGKGEAQMHKLVAT